MPGQRLHRQRIDGAAFLSDLQITIRGRAQIAKIEAGNKSLEKGGCSNFPNGCGGDSNADIQSQGGDVAGERPAVAAASDPKHRARHHLLLDVADTAPGRLPVRHGKSNPGQGCGTVGRPPAHARNGLGGSLETFSARLGIRGLPLSKIAVPPS
jgi:hypothetical protein